MRASRRRRTAGAAASGVAAGLLLAGCASPAPDAGSACPAAPTGHATTARPVTSASRAGTEQPRLLRARIVARHPHDPAAFTQGLAYAGGDQLLESTGRDSTARRVDIATGDVVAQQRLPDPLFGEGIAQVGDDAVQLTWRDGVGLVRDRCSLVERRRFAVPGEGWGLAGADGMLWRSDGTATLREVDPRTFAVRRAVQVRDRGRPVRELNELEVVGGALLANVWHSSWVARIDPAGGRVTGWVDASALVREVGATDEEAVLNGIAADPASGRVWMTGKLWPTLFEVRLEPAGGGLPPPGLTG